MNTTPPTHAHISTPEPMASMETPSYHSRALHWNSLRCPGREEEAGVPMVKFSKQFEGQLVPEWKDAFVDYWQLKKDVKNLQAAGDGVMATAVASPTAAHWVMKLPFLHPQGHKEPGAIQACTTFANQLGENFV
jgi:xenotropic and polytropic retrovirus receptor 1